MATKNSPRYETRAVPSGRLMVRMNPTLFYALGAACLFEHASRIYAQRLMGTTAADMPVCQWIETTWLPEKLHRANALQRYAVEMWPEFDWTSAAAEFESATRSSYGGAQTRSPVRESLAQSVAAAQASVFYRCLGQWAEDVQVRDLAYQASQAEGLYFERFKDAFEQRQPRERLGFWPTMKEASLRVRHTRDATLYRAFEILQGHWPGTPPFPDWSYGEFLNRARRVARREGMLTWWHRVLLRAWFHEPVLRPCVNTRERSTQACCGAIWVTPAVAQANAPTA